MLAQGLPALRRAAGRSAHRKLRLQTDYVSVDNLKSLTDKSFDVLVIGGGTVGCSVALDASCRGFKVAVVEQEDFAASTSGRSTNLFHGGIRYLEQAFTRLDRGAFNLVREALHERKHMLHAAPYLSGPCPTLIPVYGAFEALYMWFGAKFYDLFSGLHHHLPSSRFVSRSVVKQTFPNIDDSHLLGGVLYYDGRFNDTRMNTVIARTAAQTGAIVANHTKVTALRKNEQGRLCGADVTDTLSNAAFSINAKYVINASGCFSDVVRRLDDPQSTNYIEPASGVHLVLRSQFCPRTMGLLQTTSDKRVLFLLPWLESTLVGTTDSSTELTLQPEPTEAEIDFILKEVNKSLAVKINKEDIQSCWSGIRPLVRDPKTPPGETAQISREHTVLISPSQLISICGGKWTTARKMAEDTVDALCKVAGKTSSCTTRMMQYAGSDLHGSLCQGNYGVIETSIQDDLKLTSDVAHHLVSSYGVDALEVAKIIQSKRRLCRRLTREYPFIEAEIVYSMQNEMAMTMSDVLTRRIRFAAQNSVEALRSVPRVARLMRDYYHWDDDRLKIEMDQATELIGTMIWDKKVFARMAAVMPKHFQVVVKQKEHPIL